MAIPFEKVRPSRLVAEIGQIFAPPDRVRVSDACDKHFHLPEGGMFDSGITPYMVDPMNALTKRSVSSIIYASPARAGKTLGLVSGGVVYVISSNPSDTLIVHMTEESARRYSRLTVARMIKNSPRLSELQPESRDDDNILSKFFKNGMALIIGYPSPTQLSGTDYKFVFLSDYDRMGDNNEGDVFIQASKRTQTFMSAGCTVAESSPGMDFTDMDWEQSGKHEAPPVGGILGLYNDGDRRLFYWTCPHDGCGEEIMLYPGLELYDLPDHDELLAEIVMHGALTTARKHKDLQCPHCKKAITERDKNKLNKTGRWIPETQMPNKAESYWGSGYMSAFQTLESVLEKEFKALLHYHLTGEETKLKTTRNVDQGIPYIPISIRNKLSADLLERRAEKYPQGEVILGIRYLTASIDVQKFKFVVQVEGVGVNDETWIVDRFDIDLSERKHADGDSTFLMCEPPSYIEDWLQLIPKVITKRYPLYGDEKERTMGIVQVMCDSAGTEGVTENAYKFWKTCKELGLHRSFDLLKGLRPSPKANTQMLNKTVLDKSSRSARKAKVVGLQPLWLVNTTMYKDTVMANLRRTDVGASYYHFGTFLSSSFYAEFTTETRTDKGWEQGRGNNESFDLCCYNKVARKVACLRQERSSIDWRNPPVWALDWDDNALVASPKGEDDTSQYKNKVNTRDVRMRARKML